MPAAATPPPESPELVDTKPGPLAAERAALDKQRAHVEQQRRAIYDLLAALDRQGIVLENQRSALNRRAAAAVDELERTLRALSRSGELSDADRARLRAALEPPPPDPQPDEDRAAQAFVIPPEMSPPRPQSMFTDPLELNNEKLGALALERIELGRQRAALEQQRLVLEQQRLEFNQKHILLTERGGDALRERERMLRERRADGALSDADRIDMHAAMLYVDCGIYAWAPLAAANSD